MKFPYREYQRDPAPGLPEGLIYRPRIPVVIKGGAEPWGVEALVDTGSDQTILPAAPAKRFGIKFTRDVVVHVRGLHGEPDELMLGRDIRLVLTLNGHSLEWPAIIWFSEHENAIPILGHSGFLEFFTAIFDGARHELDLQPNEKFPGKETKLWE